MLGRFHREFAKRTHAVYIIKDFRSRDQQDKSGHAVQKYRLSTEVEVSLPVAGRQQTGKFMPVNTTFLYLSALKVVLFTMSKA
eukprot:6475327-Amphidinium_carterae.1